MFRPSVAGATSLPRETNHGPTHLCGDARPSIDSAMLEPTSTGIATGTSFGNDSNSIVLASNGGASICLSFEILGPAEMCRVVDSVGLAKDGRNQSFADAPVIGSTTTCRSHHPMYGPKNQCTISTRPVA